MTPVVIRALAQYSSDPLVEEALNRAMHRMEVDRLSDGTWPAFWWHLQWYTASAWVNAAISMQERLPAFHWPEEWKIDSIGTSDLDAAHLLEFSINMGRIDIAEQVAQELLRNQLEDGSWPRVPVLRQPKLGAVHPWESPDDETYYADEYGIYSTATILSAIAKWLSFKREGS